MQTASTNQESRSTIRLRQWSLAGIAGALLITACTDDAIVYPDRNLRAVAGTTNETGEAGEAGEASGGATSGGAAQGGRGGAVQGGGGALSDAGAVGETGGALPTGPVCGNGKIESPEQCDDGNAISGDGCSADCQSSCEKCEKSVCPLYPPTDETISESAYDACYNTVGRIVKGPATGFNRKEVCRELVDCVRQENCSQVQADSLDIRRCWCDQDWRSTPGKLLPTIACQTNPDPNNPLDPTKFIPGKCASLFQDASENAKLSDVTHAFSATDLAEGRAFRLLQNCDARVCTEECVAGYFNAGAIATISADIILKANTAGESPLGDLVADSQRVIAGADFALVHNGFTQNAYGDPVDLLLAPTPNRDADGPGLVLWSEALAVSFGYRATPDTVGVSLNPQATLKLNKLTFTGQQIYDALAQQFNPQVGGLLFVSGLKYSYTLDSVNPTGSVISDIRKLSDNSLIDKSQSYTVALSEFLTNTGSPIPVLKTGTSPTLVPTQIADILGEYLKQLPQPVAPPELNRITRLN